MKRILIVCAQHGNEQLGIDVMSYITDHHPDMLKYVDSVIANPEAVLKGVRYIDTDMNRSYGPGLEGKEAVLARNLLAKAQQGYDLVLDMHTTSCDMPPAVIVRAVDSVAASRFLPYSSLSHVVAMQDAMIAASLIGNCDEALSIEVNATEARSDELLKTLTSDIAAYASGATTEPAEKLVFHVDDRIRKTDDLARSGEELVNFHETSTGIYPVLVGENSYKQQTDYLGFSASTKKSLKI